MDQGLSRTGCEYSILHGDYNSRVHWMAPHISLRSQRRVGVHDLPACLSDDLLFDDLRNSLSPSTGSAARNSGRRGNCSRSPIIAFKSRCLIKGKRIAVVMPAYNAAKTLAQTVSELPDSVDLKILVEDHSTDDTAKIAC